MKILKIAFMVGCVFLFTGDAFLIFNAIKPDAIPGVIVLPVLLLGIFGLICGIIYCRPKKPKDPQ